MYHAINLKGEIWKVTDSAIGYSSTRILDTGINSGWDRCEANEVVNDVHRMHTNIHNILKFCSNKYFL